MYHIARTQLNKTEKLLMNKIEINSNQKNFLSQRKKFLEFISMLFCTKEKLGKFTAYHKS